MTTVLLDTNIVSYLLTLVTHNPDDYQNIPGLTLLTEA